MREALCLNGLWAYEPVAWQVVQKDGSYRTVDKELPASGTMPIPGNWHHRGLENFYGTVRFIREFSYTPSADGCLPYLCFTGVDYACEVYLNGHRAGRHEGCFQPFEFEVASFIQEGVNVLEVVVESPNEEPDEVWPHRKHLIKGILSHWDARPGGWDRNDGQDGNTGGIWGDVRLEYRNPIHLESVKVHTQILPNKPEKGFFLTAWEDRNEVDLTPRAYVWFRLEANNKLPAGSAARAAITLTSDDGNTVTEDFPWDGGDELNALLVLDHPKLWWTWDLGQPHLYQVEVALWIDGQHADTYSFRTGIREVEVDPDTGTWRLNGKRLFIRGTNVIPTLWLGEYSQEMIDTDIRLLQAAHINGTRVCVHVTCREWYEACDREGILIWQDFPLQWGYAANKSIVQSACRQIMDMVRSLYNHPSIGLWCCQNESLVFNNEVVGPQLARAAREEDASRCVHQVSHFGEHPYNGWYNGTMEDYRFLPGARMIAEFGAQALPSAEETIDMNGSAAWPPDWDRLAYHNFQYDQTFFHAKIDKGDGWEAFVANSQAYQAQLLKTAVESFRCSRFTKVGSIFQFMFMDAWPAITWSVVSHRRIPKQGYITLQQVNQPILVGTTLGRNTWLSSMQKGGGDPHNTITPWVINDLHQTYENCLLTISMEPLSEGASGTEILGMQTVHVEPDSIRHLETIRYRHVDRFSPGEYRLVLTLEWNHQVLSKNSYPIFYGV